MTVTLYVKFDIGSQESVDWCFVVNVCCVMFWPQLCSEAPVPADCWLVPSWSHRLTVYHSFTCPAPFLHLSLPTSLCLVHPPPHLPPVRTTTREIVSDKLNLQTGHLTVTTGVCYLLTQCLQYIATLLHSTLQSTVYLVVPTLLKM